MLRNWTLTTRPAWYLVGILRLSLIICYNGACFITERTYHTFVIENYIISHYIKIWKLLVCADTALSWTLLMDCDTTRPCLMIRVDIKMGAKPLL